MRGRGRERERERERVCAEHMRSQFGCLGVVSWVSFINIGGLAVNDWFVHPLM